MHHAHLILLATQELIYMNTHIAVHTLRSELLRFSSNPGACSPSYLAS